jgi:hypothetical protein
MGAARAVAAVMAEEGSRMSSSLRFTARSLTATALFGVLFFAAAQSNAACVTDAECGQGFSCEVVGGSACPGYACADGEECPPPPECTAMDIRDCVPSTCTTDTECASGMVCHTSTTTTCSGGTKGECPPGSDCPEPTPPECIDQTESRCVPKYMLPCTADADCGGGFRCVEQESCSCSGSAPRPSDSGGAEPAPPVEPAPPECSCQKTGEFACEIVETPCTTDAECESDWSCVDDPNTAVSCGPPAEGSPDTCATEPTNVARLCLPPYYQYQYGGVSQGEDSGGAPTSGGVSGAPRGNSADGSGSATPPPAAPAEAESGDGASSSDDGCQISAGSQRNTTAGAIVALLAGLLVTRRRRPRAHS